MKASHLLVLLILSCSLQAQTSSTPEPTKAAREFVEEFYQWYVPKALSENETPASDLALRQRGPAFSPQLGLLLKRDSIAQAKCKEIIGIDFDPLLYTQDPDEQYVVGEVRKVGAVYRADIFGVRSGTRIARPALIAELSESDGHWFFVNFYYPHGSDLVTILKSPLPKCSMPR